MKYGIRQLLQHLVLTLVNIGIILVGAAAARFGVPPEVPGEVCLLLGLIVFAAHRSALHDLSK